MPYKDTEQRDKYQKQWRKKAYTPAYLKWLYARRKLQTEKMEHYENALTIIMHGADGYAIGFAALKWTDDREREVGNRFDHELDKPYYKEG